jgi:hypothetical protein
MLSDSDRLTAIEEKLGLLVEAACVQSNSIESFNKRMLGFESTFAQMRRFTQESLTYIKRIQPYINKAMKTLHDAFRMVANGILNLREETSEFAGTVIDSELDVRIV